MSEGQAGARRNKAEERKKRWGKNEGKKNATSMEEKKTASRFCRLLALFRSFRAVSAESACASLRWQQEQEKRQRLPSSAAEKTKRACLFFFFFKAAERNGIASRLFFHDASCFLHSLSPPSLSLHVLCCSLCRVRGLPVDARRVVGRAAVGAARGRAARLLANAAGTANAAAAAAAAAVLGRGVIDEPLVAEEAGLVVALAEA